MINKTLKPPIANRHANSQNAEIRKPYGAFVGTKSMWCFSWQSSGPCDCVERRKGQEMSGHEATHTACEPSPQGDRDTKLWECRGKVRTKRVGEQRDEVMTKFLSWALGLCSRLESLGREMEYPLLSRNHKARTRKEIFPILSEHHTLLKAGQL